MRNATIKSVALDAGVSVATVSRVINKTGNVSQSLVKAVNRSIEKLNYYPNSVARSLKFDSTHSIGLIVSDISNSFFSYLARSIEDAIQSSNYNMIVCSTDNQKDKELAYLQLLLSKKVDGIIINATGMNDDFIASMSHTVPVVLCGRNISNPSFRGDFVDSENETGSFRLTQHLIQQGHWRIGVVNGQGIVSSAKERLAGFARAMKSIGISVDEHYPYYCEADFNNSQSGSAAAETLLTLPNPPSAIIAMNNELATGILRYCHNQQIRIPQNLSVCSYGRILNHDLLYVQPDHVIIEPSVLGGQIACFMLERIAGKNKLDNREMRFTAPLIKGNERPVNLSPLSFQRGNVSFPDKPL